MSAARVFVVGRRVSLGLIVGLFLNAIALAYGAGLLSQRVAELERRVATVETMLADAIRAELHYANRLQNRN